MKNPTTILFGCLIACLHVNAANNLPITFSVPGHVAKRGVFVSLIGENVGSATSGGGPWVYAAGSGTPVIASTLKTFTTNTTGNAPDATIHVESVEGFPSAGGDLLVTLPGQEIRVSYTATDNATRTFTGVTFTDPLGPGIAANATVTLAENILAPTLTVNSTQGFPSSGVVMLQPAPGSVAVSRNIIVSYNGTTAEELLNVAPYPGGGDFPADEFLASGGPVILLSSPDSGSMVVTYASAQGFWDSAATAGVNTPPVNLFPDAGSFSDNATYNATLTLPDYATDGIQSGVAVIGVGGAVPIAPQDAAGKLGSPSVESALDVVFGIFEWGLVNSASGLDFDVSEVDQVGFPFRVNTRGASPPPPADPVLGVGLLQDRETLFSSFQAHVAALPDEASRTAFAQCEAGNPDAPYPVGTRITAPQDITGIFVASPPVALGASPAGNGTVSPDPITAYYAVTALSANGGESAPSQAIKGTVSANSTSTLKVVWQPYDYATGYNLYWSTGITDDGSNLLVSPRLIATISGGGNTTHLDTTPGGHSGDVVVLPANNHGYNPLNSYLDASIKDFFDYYSPGGGNATFELDDQSTSTKWSGQVATVAMNGVNHRMLQLTGGSGQWGDAHAGAVVNLVEPFFSSNTDNAGNPAPPVVIPSGVDFTSLQSSQLPYIGNGTIVIDQNGGLWRYNGSGSKTDPSSYSSNGTNAALAGMALDVTQSPTAMAFGAQGVFGNFVGNGTTLDMTNAKNVWNNIVTAIVRGLTPRLVSGNWTNTIRPDYWSNQPVIQPPTQSAGGNLTANGTYRYTLTCYGVLGDSSADETPESSPATVYLSGSNRTVVVNWTAVNFTGGAVGAQTAAGFHVYRSEFTSGEWSPAQRIGSVTNNATVPVSSFTDDGTSAPGVEPSVTWYSPDTLCDHYAGFFKDPSVSINGLSYGYAYDDKGNTSTNVQMDPSGVTEVVITLNAWEAAGGQPTIVVDGSLAAFSTTNGTASASQSFTVSGSGLEGGVSVAAPSGFEVSTGSSSYGSGLTLPSANGTLASTEVFARIAASAPAGALGGNITLSSSNATAQEVAVTGSVGPSAQTPYEAWIGSYPALTGNATGGSADPDGDGYVNDAEFAFDGDPTVPTAALLDRSITGGNMTVSFVARKTVPAGASYEVQASSNLLDGFSTDGGVVVTTSADQGGILLPAQYERREFSVPLDGAMGFWRVKATLGE